MYYEDWKKKTLQHTSVIDVSTLNITVTEPNSAQNQKMERGDWSEGSNPSIERENKGLIPNLHLHRRLVFSFWRTWVPLHMSTSHSSSLNLQSEGGLAKDTLAMKTQLTQHKHNSLQLHKVNSFPAATPLSPWYTYLVTQEITATYTLCCHPGVK